MKKLLLIAAFILSATSADAAIRRKTIEYAFPLSTTSTATATTRILDNITVYIPETTGRKFVSVYTVTGGLGAETTATNITAQTTAIGIDAVAYSTVTFTDTFTNSGEGNTWLLKSSFTAYFQTNFTGTSHTIKGNTVTTGITSNNVAVKLIITYDYDDSATTRIKTVRIPINSSTGSIPALLTEIGTNQVPALDTFLPEVSKTYRDIFFEIYTNEGTTAAVAPNPGMGLSLDAEAESSDGLHEDVLVSARSYYRLWKRTDMNTSTTHQFKANTDNTAMPFPVIGAVLTVTYEYDHSASTSIINSIMVPVGYNRGFMGGSTVANQDRFQREIWVNEPGPITLRQSGILLNLVDSGAMTISLAAGSQAHSTYTIPATVICGQASIYHRIDLNNGFSLNRGSNTLTVNVYTQSASLGSMISHANVMAYINYVSSKSAQGGGDANHQQTTLYLLQPAANDNTKSVISSLAHMIINEASYYIQDVFYWLLHMMPSTTSAALSVSLDAEVQAGETGADGFKPLFSSMYNSDGELGFTNVFFGATDNFKRYPGATDGVFISSNSRAYYASTNFSTYIQLSYGVTMYSATSTITGTISNYTGGGSGITVSIFDSLSGKFLTSTTTASGGTFSVPWYLDTLQVFAEAYQDSTHSGRSADIYPGQTAADIDFQMGTGGGGGGAASFTFVQ